MSNLKMITLGFKLMTSGPRPWMATGKRPGRKKKKRKKAVIEDF